MNNWRIVKLGEVSELIKDGTHGTHKNVKDGPFLLSAQNVENGNIIMNENDRKISEKDFNLIHHNYKMQDNDVLITIVGTLGRCAILKNYHDEFTFQRSVAIVRFDEEKILPQFAYYQIRTDRFQKELKRRENKGAQGGVYLGELTKILMVVPDLETQRKIVQILDMINQEMDYIETQITAEKQKLNALCQKLIYSNDPNKKLNDIAKLVNGYAFKSSDYVESGKYYIITIANVQDGTIDLNNVNKIDTLPNDLREWQKLDLGDIVLSMTGNVGRIAIIDKDNCLLNQRVGKIIPTNINKDYLYFALSFIRFRKRMKHMAQGGAQDNLSVKDINDYLLYVPDANSQMMIAECLRTQQLIINKLESSLKIKKGLYYYFLNHLMNGDFDLSNIKLEKGKE